MIDVIIAGGGPNGLMLACELALAGIRPVVCERRTGPTTEQRANGLVGQVVRMLDRRGLYQRIVDDQHVPGHPAPTQPQPQPRYVFGALPLDLSQVPDNPVYTLPVPQPRLERLFAARAAELGVEVRHGCAVTGLTQQPDSVTATLADGTTLTGRYLVGADGGQSVVRKAADIGFPGVTVDNSVSRSAHVSLPADLVDPATGGLAVPGYGVVPPFQHTRTERGLIVWAPFPGRQPAVTTVEWPESTDYGDTPMTLAEMRASVARVLGADVPFGPPLGDGPHLLRRLVGGNTRIAQRYRDGRVLLLGDAAHVHPPIGGPGLNLGLQDAINLGWKLAAQLHGWAPDGLLDTYEAERRPAAQRVTMSTQAQSALIAPGSDVTALRTLVAELLAEAATAAQVAALLAGADLRYDMGTPGGSLVGRWAPDLVLFPDTGAVRLAEATRTARPLLLDATGTLATGTLATVTEPWRDRVDVIAGKIDLVTAPDGSTPPTALLLRPDCYVAWASSAEDPDPDELRDALTRWFGPAIGTSERTRGRVSGTGPED
ncbi:FAD-dependent monooxygenase [Solwaraspora sp. WMMD791]|uniref:FAD-dependent monooxygenase n=1 Tax=Solwaraspora sp. WMMD791 TaxID=3016086 RepID=UPI00249A04BD|nr:FAD-dependent monooxygenase [Solwaraspora sp. WMMD791]WFE26473.1 FAD-dependent monooxygenase [Solwaraspora sp. WMMD791]